MLGLRARPNIDLTFNLIMRLSGEWLCRAVNRLQRYEINTIAVCNIIKSFLMTACLLAPRDNQHRFYESEVLLGHDKRAKTPANRESRNRENEKSGTTWCHSRFFWLLFNHDFLSLVDVHALRTRLSTQLPTVNRPPATINCQLSTVTSFQTPDTYLPPLRCGWCPSSYSRSPHRPLP